MTWNGWMWMNTSMNSEWKNRWKFKNNCSNEGIEKMEEMKMHIEKEMNE